MTQMIRWGQVREPFAVRRLAERVYRPDLYRRAVSGLPVELPASDYKTEGCAPPDPPGEPMQFFAGERFDPDAAMAYLRGPEVRAASADLEAHAALNR
jgi:hypothetical protein